MKDLDTWLGDLLQRTTINVDLDGVIYPFIEMISHYIRGQRFDGTPGVDPECDEEHLEACFAGYPPPSHWEVWEDWDMTQGEWESWFRRGINDGWIWKEGPVITGAQNALWRLSDEGYNIRIVTARLKHIGRWPEAITNTVEWLERANIPYRALAFTGNESKTDYKADIMVDDKLTTIFDQVSAGRVGILFDQPWNQLEGTPPTGGTFYRARGWDDVYRIVKEVS